MDGWLSPNGEFYDAELDGHVELADKIIIEKRLMPKLDSLTGNLAAGERLLEILGWIKLKEETPELLGGPWDYTESVSINGGLESMTNDQFRFLKENSWMLDEYQMKYFGSTFE